MFVFIWNFTLHNELRLYDDIKQDMFNFHSALK